jgi:hypothetical protein
MMRRKQEKGKPGSGREGVSQIAHGRKEWGRGKLKKRMDGWMVYEDGRRKEGRGREMVRV